MSQLKKTMLLLALILLIGAGEYFYSQKNKKTSIITGNFYSQYSCDNIPDSKKAKEIFVQNLDKFLKFKKLNTNNIIEQDYIDINGKNSTYKIELSDINSTNLAKLEQEPNWLSSGDVAINLQQIDTCPDKSMVIVYVSDFKLIDKFTNHFGENIDGVPYKVEKR